jgi:hypothetical protein
LQSVEDKLKEKLDPEDKQKVEAAVKEALEWMDENQVGGPISLGRLGLSVSLGGLALSLSSGLTAATGAHVPAPEGSFY